MTNLISQVGQPTATNNNFVQKVSATPTAPTAPVQYSTAPQTGLSPEAKSTLLSGFMASIMGALWFSNPKVESANKLVQLEKDKFESTTKKLSESKVQEEIEALNYFKSARTKINSDIPTQVERIFANNKELSATDIAKAFGVENFTDISALDANIKAAEENLFKQKIAIITASGNEKTVTEDTIKKLEELLPDDNAFIEKFKKDLPAGTELTKEKLQEFHTNNFAEPELKIADQKKLRTILLKTNDKGMVTKADTLQALKQHHIDTDLETLKANFEAIKKKLPQTRLKSAAKWFGLGIGISILSNMIFSMFGRKKADK